MTYEPKILAFVCNWCAYGSTESAGVTKRNYPANVKMIRVTCSARVQRDLILEAMQNKIDGIIVLACNIGNCHYMDGNKRAKIRVESTARFAKNVGIDPQRIQFQEIRASEGDKLAEKLTSFVNQIKKLGPL